MAEMMKKADVFLNLFTNMRLNSNRIFAVNLYKEDIIGHISERKETMKSSEKASPFAGVKEMENTVYEYGGKGFERVARVRQQLMDSIPCHLSGTCAADNRVLPAKRERAVRFAKSKSIGKYPGQYDDLY